MMRTCLRFDPTSLDPRKNGDPCTSTLQFLIYEGLTQFKENGEVELSLAESVDISEDGKIYTFHLKEAFWSDGHPIVAEDFEHSWKKTMTPEFGASCPQLFYPIENGEKVIRKELSPDFLGVKAIDSKTLEVRLENPTPYFLSLITFCNFFPIPKHVEINNSHWEHSPVKELVQSGPFLLTDWKKNRELVFKKNPSYWNAAQIHLDRIEMSILPDERTTIQMFLNGELDFVSTVTTPLPLESLADCRKRGILQNQPVGGFVFCSFNLERPPLDNLHLRKALSLSIDRPSIAENIAQLKEQPATQFLPPIFGLTKRDLFPSFDPTTAQQELELALQELKMSKKELEKKLSLSFQADDLYTRIAQTIQSTWATYLDLKIPLCKYDQKTTIAKHMNRDYEIAVEYCISQFHDPSSILDRFKYKITKKNYPGFENEKYIDLLTQASKQKDPEKRFCLLEQAEDILNEELPIAPIYYYNIGELSSREFSHYEISPIGNLLYKKIQKSSQ